MARKRASMREGPLAELFRATEAAQRQGKNEPDPEQPEPEARLEPLEETVEHAPPFDPIVEVQPEPEPAPTPKPDLRPVEEPRGGWRCNACARVFTVQMATLDTTRIPGRLREEAELRGGGQA